jgi:hypothetical protein
MKKIMTVLMLGALILPLKEAEPDDSLKKRN